MKNPFKPKLIGAHKMRRWHLTPRNRWFNVYLHKHVADDDTRALHDHPWPSVSIRLGGGKLTEVIQPDETLIEFIQETRNESREEIFKKYVEYRQPPRVCFRSAEFAHRLEVPGRPVWTLFLTGKYVREWGFHCPKGWVAWHKMTQPDGTPIGGCDDATEGVNK